MEGGPREPERVNDLGLRRQLHHPHRPGIPIRFEDDGLSPDRVAHEPVAGSLLCRVGKRIGDGELQALEDKLLDWHTTDDGERLLQTLRLSRFDRLDRDRLRRTIERFEAEPDRP